MYPAVNRWSHSGEGSIPSGGANHMYINAGIVYWLIMRRCQRREVSSILTVRAN